MNTKHTPGPWRQSTANPNSVNKDGEKGAIGIATAHGTDDSNYAAFFPSTDEARANALLIAAAPELLEALMDARPKVASAAAADAIKWTSDIIKVTEHVREQCRTIDAAIAKAKATL